MNNIVKRLVRLRQQNYLGFEKKSWFVQYENVATKILLNKQWNTIFVTSVVAVTTVNIRNNIKWDMGSHGTRISVSWVKVLGLLDPPTFIPTHPPLVHYVASYTFINI